MVRRASDDCKVIDSAPDGTDYIVKGYSLADVFLYERLQRQQRVKRRVRPALTGLIREHTAEHGITDSSPSTDLGIS